MIKSATWKYQPNGTTTDLEIGTLTTRRGRAIASHITLEAAQRLYPEFAIAVEGPSYPVALYRSQCESFFIDLGTVVG